MRAFGGYVLAVLGVFFLYAAFIGLTIQLQSGRSSPEYAVFAFFAILGFGFLWWAARVYTRWRRAVGIWALVFSLLFLVLSQNLGGLGRKEVGPDTAAYAGTSRVVMAAVPVLLLTGVLLLLAQRTRDREVRQDRAEAALVPASVGSQWPSVAPSPGGESEEAQSASTSNEDPG